MRQYKAETCSGSPYSVVRQNNAETSYLLRKPVLSGASKQCRNLLRKPVLSGASKQCRNFLLAQEARTQWCVKTMQKLLTCSGSPYLVVRQNNAETCSGSPYLVVRQNNAETCSGSPYLVVRQNNAETSYLLRKPVLSGTSIQSIWQSQMWSEFQIDFLRNCVMVFKVNVE